MGLLIGAVAIVAQVELYVTLRRMGRAPSIGLGTTGGIAVLIAAYIWGPLAIFATVAMLAAALAVWAALSRQKRYQRVGIRATLLAVVWVPGLIALAMPIVQAEGFRTLVLAVLAITVAMDSGQYVAGRVWGRTHFAPRLSPNKTMEGLFGGVVLTLIVALAIAQFRPFNLGTTLALAGWTLVAAPVGDLTVSRIKRSVGVKDLASTVPGHGGVMDFIDSLLFVLPGAYVVFLVAGFLS